MDEREEINSFMSNLWFYVFFFLILLMIASFGMIAEA